MFEIVVFSVFPLAMIYAATSDLFSMTISNRLTAGFALAFFGVALYCGLDATQIAWHLSAGAAMLALGFALFAFGWIGGGDAKFFAATAIWLGWSPLFEYALWTAILGGVLTAVIIVIRKMPLPEILMRQTWAARLHNARQGIPYGIALALAGLLIYPSTPLIPLILG